MYRVLFAVPAQRFDKIFTGEVREQIAGVCKVIDAEIRPNVDRGYLLRNGAEADILITSWGTPAIDAETVSGMPSLKLVAHAAGSIKPVMSEAAWKRSIRATSAARAIALGVAEFCLGFMLTVPKRIFWSAERLRAGSWPKSDEFFGPSFEIYRQNVGIIGASMVGRRLIELLRPMQCRILLYDPYCSPSESQDIGATKVDTLDEIFSECRVVSLNAPVTAETEGMVRGYHFAKLKEGSVFINTARGVIVRQDEMVEELRRGRFVACLDVTHPEPLPIDHELRRLPNVILTPHIAGCIAENLMRIGEFIAAEIGRYAAGQDLAGEITHDRLGIMA